MQGKTITDEQIEAIKAKANEHREKSERYNGFGYTGAADREMSKALGIREALNMLGIEF